MTLQPTPVARASETGSCGPRQSAMLYLSKETPNVFIPFGFIGIYRWFWFAIKVIAWVLYKPQKPKAGSRYTSQDVTILVPTIDSGDEIKIAVRSWLKNDPFQIIFITINKAKQGLEDLANEVDPRREKIHVICIEKPNKRNQMVAGINHCNTDIIVFCDDDVIWPETMLQYMLAPFEDAKMGGVGTSQRVIPVGKSWTLWEVLSAYRISMRNIEVTSSTYIDGGVCCLSGRTAAYRADILRDSDFQWQFTHEYWHVWWFGKWRQYHQHSGDDKFLTRWIVSHNWKTHVQACKQAELASTFKNNWRFLKQITRWTRNTWRSDIKSLFLERKIWRRYPFVAYQMFDKFFNPLTLLYGPISILTMCINHPRLPVWVILVSYTVWLLLTRLLKYIPHFVSRPQDILYLPAWLIFNYYFAISKIYCLFTLHNTDWGTRQGADHSNEKEDLSIFDVHKPSITIITSRDSHPREVAQVVTSPSRLSSMKLPCIIVADGSSPEAGMHHRSSASSGTSDVRATTAAIKKTSFAVDTLGMSIQGTPTSFTSCMLSPTGPLASPSAASISQLPTFDSHAQGQGLQKPKLQRISSEIASSGVKRFFSLHPPTRHLSFMDRDAAHVRAVPECDTSDAGIRSQHTICRSQTLNLPRPHHQAAGDNDRPRVFSFTTQLSRAFSGSERAPERNTFKNWD
ncbi:hypothetical protein SeLEV6574_g01309 [Synchytrium endobioticum]|uniref:Glycosyltransferase 2-like domain-containing protein n=1 Tax=Synchytrium endobioticum TaxID=286115 RepID=A0A507DD91_9FUNG|nr:hypothetical protein SeLEV6574_g01309 [Synchytrium endobioticum]